MYANVTVFIAVFYRYSNAIKMVLLPCLMFGTAIMFPLTAVNMPCMTPLGLLVKGALGDYVAKIFISFGTSSLGSTYVFMGLSVLMTSLDDIDVWHPIESLKSLGDTLFYLLVGCAILSIIGTIFQVFDVALP